MEVKQQLPVAHQAAAGNVSIAQHHAAARMFLGVRASHRKDPGIVIKMGIVVVHDLHLAPVDPLKPKINIRDLPGNKTKAAFPAGSHPGRRHSPHDRLRCSGG